jgi:hypothetical protein
MKKLLTLLILLAFAGCGYAPHNDPALFTYTDEKVLMLSAQLHARDKGGVVAQVNCCGSMKPLIQNGDWIVIVPTPFTADLLGKVVSYHPQWAKGGNIVHRLVSGTPAGFIASGDNNPTSEPTEPVTASIYNGEVIAIYRFIPSKP